MREAALGGGRLGLGGWAGGAVSKGQVGLKSLRRRPGLGRRSVGLGGRCHLGLVTFEELG